MAREEKQANIYAIPKNSFDTGYVFGGQFKTRNFVEGVVVTFVSHLFTRHCTEFSYRN